MKPHFAHTCLFVFALLVSTCLGTNAQTTFGERNELGDPTQKDCESCLNPFGGTAPDLGTAAPFAVLGASTVTNTGPSVVRGDLGVSPGTAITGFPPGTVFGTLHAGTTTAADAQADALIAYNDLDGQACDVDLTGQDLGGLTLTPGVYCFDTTAQLTGILTLDGPGGYVFQIGSTLTTATDSSIVLINDANACDVFFQVGSSATLGTATAFQGNILALASITLNTEASLEGRAIALTGAVTLDTNDVRRCDFAPTAAGVNLGGRVTNGSGIGISLALITMSDSSGFVRTAFTSPFGYYRFEDVPVGQTVILTVGHKRYTFSQPTIVIDMNDEISTANFVAY